MDKSYISAYYDINGNINCRNLIKKTFVINFSIVKYLFDRLFAILGIIITLPIMIIIAILIKIDSKGPVLFKQKRTGKNGKEFNIYKFRTMIVNNNVHDYSRPDEHTKLGKILRKTSIDELPQLISIAIGKMSFIGPRPWIPEYYKNMNETQRHRNDVLPGLTGLAQVSGRNNINIFEKINYDLEYIRKYSFTQDVKIIFLTVKTVFTGKAADAGKDTIQKEIMDLKNQDSKKKEVI